MISPVMAVLFSAAFLAFGVERIQQTLLVPVDIRGAIPFTLASIFCIMTTTCTSISLEGKEWWIVKSLPIKTKDVLDSKVLLNLSLILPFFLMSEVLLIIALQPDFVELIWLLVIPIIMIFFGCILGITVNLKMPVFDWENEVVIVKQSASAMIGGIGWFIIVLLCMILVLVFPAEYANLVKVVICVVITFVTAFLYKKNNAVNLQEL